ncbi:hypothetical protein KFF05_12550 [bacterium SCSIO 12827]|nr:hypothetical protein KFF05_12550 [bacterium SCSIO 12827]
MKAEIVGETPYKKFMFDTDFDELAERREKARAKAAAEAAMRDAGEPEPEPEPEPEAPTYSEDDLARAREEGLAEGKRLGTEEASSTVDKQIADTLNTIAQQTQSLFEAQTEANEGLTHHAISVAAALVRKLFPTLNHQTAQDQVQSMLETVLGQLSGEPEIIVRVPADLAESLHERIQAVSELSGFRGNIKLLGDPGLAVGDCRLEWSSGGVMRSANDLARELDDIVARNLKTPATPETDPEPATDTVDAPQDSASPAAELESAQPVETVTDAPPEPADEMTADADAGSSQAVEPMIEGPATQPETVETTAAPQLSPPRPSDAAADGPPPVPSEEIMAEVEIAAPAAPDSEEDTHAPVPSEDLITDAAPKARRTTHPHQAKKPRRSRNGSAGGS